MKTVLAPMFALRNLKVMSWVGHNIFGNRDGLVLDDPIQQVVQGRNQGPRPHPDPGLPSPRASSRSSIWPTWAIGRPHGTTFIFRGSWARRWPSSSRGKDAIACWPLRWRSILPGWPTSRSDEGTRVDETPRVLFQEPGGGRGRRLLQAIQPAGWSRHKRDDRDSAAERKDRSVRAAPTARARRRRPHVPRRPSPAVSPSPDLPGSVPSCASPSAPTPTLKHPFDEAARADRLAWIRRPRTAGRRAPRLAGRSAREPETSASSGDGAEQDWRSRTSTRS